MQSKHADKLKRGESTDAIKRLGRKLSSALLLGKEGAKKAEEKVHSEEKPVLVGKNSFITSKNAAHLKKGQDLDAGKRLGRKLSSAILKRNGSMSTSKIAESQNKCKVSA